MFVNVEGDKINIIVKLDKYFKLKVIVIIDFVVKEIKMMKDVVVIFELFK